MKIANCRRPITERHRWRARAAALLIAWAGLGVLAACVQYERIPPDPLPKTAGEIFHLRIVEPGVVFAYRPVGATSFLGMLDPETDRITQYDAGCHESLRYPSPWGDGTSILLAFKEEKPQSGSATHSVDRRIHGFRIVRAIDGSTVWEKRFSDGIRRWAPEQFNDHSIIYVTETRLGDIYFGAVATLGLIDIRTGEERHFSMHWPAHPEKTVRFTGIFSHQALDPNTVIFLGVNLLLVDENRHLLPERADHLTRYYVYTMDLLSSTLRLHPLNQVYDNLKMIPGAYDGENSVPTSSPLETFSYLQVQEQQIYFTWPGLRYYRYGEKMYWTSIAIRKA